MARRTLTGPISMVLGYALLASTAQAAPAASDGDPFGVVDLPAGYELDRMHGEGKCGEGKCGESKAEEGKCGEGKCGADGEKGEAEGKCGEGKCGGDDGGKNAEEGKCGEGKCGGSH